MRSLRVTSMTLGVAIAVCALTLSPIPARAARFMQPLNMMGNAITNAGVVQSITGLFVFVPAASGSMPVPYWQLTNTVNLAPRPVATLVSGDADTNRTDILVSTNYAVSGVYVRQAAPTNQFVYVFTNKVAFDSFALGGLTASRAISINVRRFDLLGIATSNPCSSIDFAFEGNGN